MKKSKGKIEEKKRSLLKLLVVAGVFLFFFSFAYTTSAYDVCQQVGRPYDCPNAGYPDSDKDGMVSGLGCGEPPGLPSPKTCSGPDCNDSDPWSHSFGSKDIASVKVEYAPAYVTKTQTERKFTPDSKKFNPFLGDLLVTVTFKAKKCGTPTTPDFVPMNVYYTTKDASGKEVFSFLPGLTTPDNRTPRYLAKVSDLVYRGTILTYGGDPRFFPANLEPYIASVAAGRPVELKFVGPDIGPNKDTPKYQPLPMTNCAQVYGAGKYKTVYMRGMNKNDNGGVVNLTTLSSEASSVITRLDSTDPFKSINTLTGKKYSDEFSHFIDLKVHNDRLPVGASGGELLMSYFTPSKSSSCKLGRVYFFNNAYISRSYAAMFFGNPNVYLALGDITRTDAPVLFHEFGHAFAGLVDEYMEKENVSDSRSPVPFFPIRNCSTDPEKDFYYKNYLKSVDADFFPGCWYHKTTVLGKPIWRSSWSSIMGDPRNADLVDGKNKLNVVSCGYTLKALKKGGTAKSYWPECAAMPGIIPVTQ